MKNRVNVSSRVLRRTFLVHSRDMDRHTNEPASSGVHLPVGGSSATTCYDDVAPGRSVKV
jgi:hypothetical protein